MKDFLNAYMNISETVEELVLMGTKLALGVLITGIIAYKYNEWFVGGYKNMVFALQIIQTAWKLFVITVLGGICIDCYEKSKNG